MGVKNTVLHENNFEGEKGPAHDVPVHSY